VERLERAKREFVFIVQLEFDRRDPTRGERQYKGTLSPTNVIKFQERTIEPDGRVSYVYIYIHWLRITRGAYLSRGHRLWEED